MCSVVGCASWRRGARRFKLPEDPERRLEWVQYLAAVNKQRFKESCWTDITICSEHFKDDCFDKLDPNSDVTGSVQLRADAVPSACLQPETDAAGAHLDRETCEPVENGGVVLQHDQLKASNLTSCCKDLWLTPMGTQGNSVPKGILCSVDKEMSSCFQMKPENLSIDLSKEKARLLKMEGKYVVNEKRLLQLFSSRCPSCGGKLQLEKVVCGLLLMVNQRCLQCEYRSQWKSQANASVTAEEQHFMTGAIEIMSERFNLPEDPERRLEWVQFIFEVNGQRLKESSWTDISICSEHFTGDCFENVPGSVQLKARAVPSQCVEPVETADVACQCDDPGSYAVTTEHMQMQHNVANKEKRHQMFIVNERCLFQLFRRMCPSCGRKLRTEKVTRGVLIVLNQRCLRCEYRNQWKSQVDACVSPNEDQHLTEDAEAASTGDSSSSKTVSEVVTFSDEESDSSDGGEDDDEAEVSSEGEWTLNEHIALAEELTEDETDDEGEEEEDFISQSGLKINELCTECGCFFNVRKPHTCEHKIKPYSCNICGKRCVTELSLKSHSTIHNETYEHPCKFCHMTFKTRLDKLKHEQIHQERRDPYKCPDCPETFATNGERRVHLSNHRTPKAVNCGICRMGFTDVHHLQRHSVVHTGLKPYKCSVCQRGFNQGSHLKSHMRLHTGERPFKCQHCDKHFNHNVSLKSHVQRHHSSSSGRKQRINKGSSGAGDADVNGNKKDTKSHCETVEEQDTEEEVQKEKMRLPKSRWRCTGRPKGRPKRNTEGNIAAPGQQEKPRLITKSVKPKRLKIACSSEDEQSDSDVSLNSAEDSEEAEEKEAAKKSTRTARGRKSKRSDSDCDPGEETNRKRYSSQNSDNGKSPGRSRGRTEKAF